MDELLSILSEMHPEVDFGSEEHLIDNGILDSLDIVSLITEIGDVFDITITAKDIVPENFNSSAALWALIERIQEEA